MRLVIWFLILGFFFFFNDTATTEIYTLSLHDALPISHASHRARPASSTSAVRALRFSHGPTRGATAASSSCESRSEEHTSELQSRLHLVCRLLLEKKKSCSTTSSGRAPRCWSRPRSAR